MEKKSEKGKRLKERKNERKNEGNGVMDI